MRTSSPLILPSLLVAATLALAACTAPSPPAAWPSWAPASPAVVHLMIPEPHSQREPSGGTAIPLDDHRLLTCLHVLEAACSTYNTTADKAQRHNMAFPMYLDNVWAVSVIEEMGSHGVGPADWVVLRTIAGGDDMNGRLTFPPAAIVPQAAALFPGEVVMVAGYPRFGKMKLVVASGMVGAVNADGSFTIVGLNRPDGAFEIGPDTGGLSGGIVLAAPLEGENDPRVVGMFIASVQTIPDILGEPRLLAIAIPDAVKRRTSDR